MVPHARTLIMAPCPWYPIPYTPMLGTLCLETCSVTPNDRHTRPDTLCMASHVRHPIPGILYPSSRTWHPMPGTICLMLHHLFSFSGAALLPYRQALEIISLNLAWKKRHTGPPHGRVFNFLLQFEGSHVDKWASSRGTSYIKPQSY